MSGRTLKNYDFAAAIGKTYGTQTTFARAVGCSEWLVSRVVNGYHKPSVDIMKEWARALKCKPAEIFK